MAKRNTKGRGLGPSGLRVMAQELQKIVEDLDGAADQAERMGIEFGGAEVARAADAVGSIWAFVQGIEDELARGRRDGGGLCARMLAAG